MNHLNQLPAPPMSPLSLTPMNIPELLSLSPVWPLNQNQSSNQNLTWRSLTPNPVRTLLTMENSSTLRWSQSLPNLNELTHLTPEQFHQYFIQLMETTSESQYQLVQLMLLMQSCLSDPDLTQTEKNSLVHSFHHLLENNA